MIAFTFGGLEPGPSVRYFSQRSTDLPYRATCVLWDFSKGEQKSGV